MVDADLRPGGPPGPAGAHAGLVRRLLRALVAAPGSARRCCGPSRWPATPELGRRFVALIDPLRYPAEGLDEAARARDPAAQGPDGGRAAAARRRPATLHTKLGRGGLSDVEWTVQLLQLRHARRGRRAAHHAHAAGAATRPWPPGCSTPSDAGPSPRRGELATRVRNAVVLVRGKAGDTLPTDVRELRAVAPVVGYRPGTGGESSTTTVG